MKSLSYISLLILGLALVSCEKVIKVDLKNAGGTVLEQPVVTDGNFVTSRHPIDVADFSRAVETWLIKNPSK